MDTGFAVSTGPTVEPLAPSLLPIAAAAVCVPGQSLRDRPVAVKAEPQTEYHCIHDYEYSPHGSASS